MENINPEPVLLRRSERAAAITNDLVEVGAGGRPSSLDYFTLFRGCAKKGATKAMQRRFPDIPADGLFTILV